MKKWTFALLLLLAAGFLPAGASDYVFRHVTTREGLASNSVRALVQDHQGLIWIGHSSGLDSFDGREVIHHAFPDGGTASILYLMEDSAQTLWIGTDYGVFRYIGDSIVREPLVAEAEITALADVVKLEKGATFQSRAKVVSIPDKTETASSKAVWKNVFVADGETFYDLYQVPEEYLSGVKEGDYIEFKGVVANYTDTWTTLEANVSEAVKLLKKIMPQ